MQNRVKNILIASSLILASSVSFAGVSTVKETDAAPMHGVTTQSGTKLTKGENSFNTKEIEAEITKVINTEQFKLNVHLIKDKSKQMDFIERLNKFSPLVVKALLVTLLQEKAEASQQYKSFSHSKKASEKNMSNTPELIKSINQGK